MKNSLFWRELLSLVDKSSRGCVSQPLLVLMLLENFTLNIKECSWLVLNILHIIIVVISQSVPPKQKLIQSCLQLILVDLNSKKGWP
jgi:hypothetical protein